MELIKMEMENYRRFFEKTTINFATGLKNVTIIRAENGSGKTGILMALLFGLFGIVHYEQFQIQDDQDFLVSSYLLQPGKTATCTISVDFMEDGIHYTIKRSISALNIDGKVIQQQSESQVESSLFKEGINLNWPKENIDSFMNGIVGQNIRGFLFFDGVKYTDLFRKNDKSTKKELQQIIEKMLNISDLDSTVSTIKSLQATVVSKPIEGKTSSELANVKNQIDELVKEKEAREALIKEQSYKLEQLKQGREKALSKFNSIKEYQDIIHEIQSIQIQIDNKNAVINNCLETINSSAASCLLSSVYTKYADESRDDFQAITFDNAGGADLVRSILTSGKCICCDEPLTDDKKARLNQYLNALVSSQTFSSSLVARAKDDVTKFSNISNGETFEKTLKSLIDNKREVQRLIMDRSSYEAKLPPDQEYEDLQKELINATKEQTGNDDLMKNVQLEIDTGTSLINEIDSKLDKAHEEKERLEEELAAKADLTQKYNFYRTVATKLQQIKAEYLEEAQRSISESANYYFLQLLSESDKALFKRLSLSDDYGIKVFDSNNREIFGQLSAGQKLLASMAFVMGLTAVASNAKPTCNFPLVMDTPFSNLDSTNRKSLISLMPTVVKQWILTPIDTELTDKEIWNFQQGGKVGKVYELNKTGISSHLVEYDNLSSLKGGIKHA